MKRQFERVDVKSLRPFLSVSFIILTLFALVFLQMEERRLSYSVLKLSRVYNKEAQNLKAKEIEVAQVFRPQHVEMIAKDKLTLKKISANQIIRMNPTRNQQSKLSHQSMSARPASTIK